MAFNAPQEAEGAALYRTVTFIFLPELRNHNFLLKKQFFCNFLHISAYCAQVMKFFAHVSTVPMRGLANSERRAARLRGLAHSAATVLQAVGWRPCD